MTKQEELQILKDCATRLGKDSYCGDALNEFLPYIATLIHSDICPDFVSLLCERIVDIKAATAELSELKSTIDTLKAKERELTARNKMLEQVNNTTLSALSRIARDIQAIANS